MDQSKPQPATPEAPKVRLEVRSKGEKGFRRAGMHFGPEPVEVELEEAQAQAVLNESMLFVRRLDGGVPAAPPAPPATSGLPGSNEPPKTETEQKPTRGK